MANEPFGMAHYPGTPVPRAPILPKPVMRAQPAVRPVEPGAVEWPDTTEAEKIQALGRALYASHVKDGWQQARLAEVEAQCALWRGIAEDRLDQVRALEAELDRFTRTQRLVRWLLFAPAWLAGRAAMWLWRPFR